MKTMNSRYQTCIPRIISHLKRERARIRRQFRDFETPPNPANPKDRKQIARDLCNALRGHIEMEREELYPTIQHILADPNTLHYNLAETTLLENLISIIDALDGTHPLFYAFVELLGEYSNRHFRDQDQTLLSEVGNALGKRSKALPTTPEIEYRHDNRAPARQRTPAGRRPRREPRVQMT